eukprot:8504096-Ditylum_brightwellii.AAC.1
MSLLNSTPIASTKGNSAMHHRQLNPPEGGKQCHSIYVRKGDKSKGDQGRNHQGKVESTKRVKVTNNTSKNNADILMECKPTSKLLLEAVTQTTGSKMLHSYAVKVDFPV